MQMFEANGANYFSRCKSINLTGFANESGIFVNADVLDAGLDQAALIAAHGRAHNTNTKGQQLKQQLYARFV